MADESPTTEQQPDERPSRAKAVPAEPVSLYTRAELLAAADSYGVTPAHMGAALHLLARPDLASREDVEAALKRLETEEV